MVYEIDLRSDTVTKPSAAMRKAMAEAIVGDDVYDEDPTVNELQQRVAKYLGKEAALFVPTGTMGNLSSVMSHCWTRGQEVILGEQSHIFMYEQGGVAQVAGVNVCTVRNNEDGTLNMEDVRNKLRPPHPDIHEPYTGLICIENSHNRCGGRVLPMSFIQEICALAKSRDIPVHMDGARIINASVYLNIPPAEIVKDCSSVSMCFSKGIGAPVGSIVAGSKEFIKRVYRCRKVLGGSMRQVGVLAAAASVGLDTAEDRMRTDYKRAKKFAQNIYDLQSKLITVDPQVIESNMLLLNFPSPSFTSQQFVNRMAEERPEDKCVVVKASTWFRNRVRFVLHSDLSEDDLEYAFQKIRSIAF